MTPSSTYRLHLTGGFTLDDARALVAHVDDLGIDWLYFSPVQTVPPGATHGYHILDPDSVNPELGGRPAWDALAAALRSRGRGLLLDIVPNHMAASVDNPWWADVLRHGPASDHAAVFDVDSFPIVLPWLDRAPETAVADGTITVAQAADGEPHLRVGDGLRLPLAPDTDVDAPLAAILDAQHYRLHEWTQGEKVLNWRRFFAVNELIGVRVEDPAVYAATHGLIERLLDAGDLQGLRVDHIDGLVDPAGYLERLRGTAGDDRWIVVEKILEADEDLPAGWPIAGTTGYEIATLLALWQLDRDGYDRLRAAFAERTGIAGPVVTALVDAKRDVLRTMFPGEMATIRRRLGPVDGVDDDRVSDVLVELAAQLHGYRTYAPPAGPIEAADRQQIDAAARRAAGVLGGRDVDVVLDALTADAGRPALLRWQQQTGPAAAKAFEDRLLYQHVALSSLCEVGMDAATLDDPPDAAAVATALHARQQAWPAAGTTTSTHDTKRSEDVRARIAVLAEVPDAFLETLERCEAVLGTPADAHARWLTLQTAIGALDLVHDDPSALTDRLLDYAQKALREAGLATSHPDPDEGYEAAVARWVTGLTTDAEARAALRSLGDRVAVPGVVNALGLVTLKLLGPGVPDVYRGTEIFDDSLVDPDNRRPLRLEAIRAARRRLADLDLDATPVEQDHTEQVASLLDGWRDGAVKLHVTRQGLHLRRTLAADTPVRPLAASGAAATHVAALQRGPAIAVTTRLPHAQAGGRWPLSEAAWGDTALDVGDDAPLLDVLTGRTHAPVRGQVAMARVLNTLPVAMLVTR